MAAAARLKLEAESLDEERKMENEATAATEATAVAFESSTVNRPVAATIDAIICDK